MKWTYRETLMNDIRKMRFKLNFLNESQEIPSELSTLSPNLHGISKGSAVGVWDTQNYLKLSGSSI